MKLGGELIAVLTKDGGIQAHAFAGRGRVLGGFAYVRV